jgi:osmotically-inducible protein OsmY
VTRLPTLRALTLATFLSLLAACSSYHAYRKCGRNGCPGDAAITAQVEALLQQHPDLGPPSMIYVSTSDRVVFLTGHSDTDLQRRTIEALTRQVPGVREVINNIAFDNLGM